MRTGSKKDRKKKPGVDRLSKLPDSVLVHILSFLPLGKAIKTEVLSKRWKSLWTYLPSLLFRQYKYEDDFEEDLEDEQPPISYDHPEEWNSYEDRDFVGFVDKTLILSNCSNVKRLRFDVEYKPSFASNVDLWVRFAAAKGTEELSLELHDHRETYRNRRYQLRQHLFSNSLFRGLHFSSCRLNPRGNVDWKSLKKLSIGEAKVSNALLEKILSGSPVLEILELYWYEGFSRLHVNNASLKKLILRSYRGPSPRSEPENEEAESEHDNEDDEADGDNEEANAEHDNEEDEAEADGAHGGQENAADGDNALEEHLADWEIPAEEDEADDGHDFEEDEGGGEEDPDGLEILAPHLQSLEICGRLPRNCQLINVSSLVVAKLSCNFKGDGTGSEEDCIRIQNELAGLLLSFAHVKSLVVGTWAMRLLSSMEAKGLSCPLLDCTSMTLEARLDDCVPWIATMLGLSPNLETLVMTKSSSGMYAGDKLSSKELQHYWTTQKRIFNCLPLHLKKVVFAPSSWILSSWFGSFVYESSFVSFVQFLLKNAKVLQKVIIHTSMLDDARPTQFYAVANKLLTFPRSSPDAVVMFCK